MKLLIVVVTLFIPGVVLAQNDLLGELEKSAEPETHIVSGTFDGTRLGNGHSIETKSAGVLEFIFQHRFGAINGGAYELFGLDEAYVRLGLDYGLTDNLSVSIGRSSTDKTIDGYLKYRVLRQRKGNNSFPFSLTALAGSAYKASPKNNRDVAPDFKSSDRLSYMAQLLMARKFTSRLSLQLMPTIVHKNWAEPDEDQTQFALGAGGRLKISRSAAITAEYYFNTNRPDNDLLTPDRRVYDAFSLGVDIETGGHVFQIVLTNAIGLTERAFITETRDNFFDGDIHLGFNVTRNFQLGKRK